MCVTVVVSIANVAGNFSGACYVGTLFCLEDGQSRICGCFSWGNNLPIIKSMAQLRVVVAVIDGEGSYLLFPIIGIELL